MPISKYFADNNLLNTQDKFAEVRRFYDIKNKNLKHFDFFYSHYSKDKHTVQHTNKNSSKQNIRTKTICFGYKNFVIHSDNGYPYFIDLPCEAKYCGGKAPENHTVPSVIDCALEGDNSDDKEVFFDNWFTSLPLVSVLKEQGIRTTGTVKHIVLEKTWQSVKKGMKID